MARGVQWSLVIMAKSLTRVTAITTGVLTSHYCTVRSVHSDLVAAQSEARSYIRRTGVLHAQCAALLLSPKDAVEGTADPRVGQTLDVVRLGSHVLALRPLEVSL